MWKTLPNRYVLDPVENSPHYTVYFHKYTYLFKKMLICF